MADCTFEIGGIGCNSYLCPHRSSPTSLHANDSCINVRGCKNEQREKTEYEILTPQIHGEDKIQRAVLNRAMMVMVRGNYANGSFINCNATGRQTAKWLPM